MWLAVLPSTTEPQTISTEWIEQYREKLNEKNMAIGDELLIFLSPLHVSIKCI